MTKLILLSIIKNYNAQQPKEMINFYLNQNLKFKEILNSKRLNPPINAHDLVYNKIC